MTAEISNAALARRRGDPLRRRHPQGARAARLAAADPARRGHSRSPSRGSATGAPPIPTRIGRSSPSGSRARSSTTSSRLQSQVSEGGSRDVVAIFGPTAAGKSAVARALSERLDGEVVSADSAALYAGIPVLTAAPDEPARLVGIVRLSHARPRSASTSAWRMQRSTSSWTRAARRSSSAEPASTSGRRSPAWSCRRRPRPASASAGAASTTSSARRGRTRSSPSATPPSAARVHPNDRTPRRTRARAGRDGVVPRTGPGHALVRRPAPSDGPRRSRPPGRRPRRADRGAGRRDDRARRPGGGQRRVVATALGDRAQGARARGVRDPAAAGGGGGGRGRHTPARPLPAEVAAPPAGRRYPRSRSRTGGDRR